MGYNNVRGLGLGDPNASSTFTDHDDSARVGSYGFLDEPRFHELNCLFERGTWFASNRDALFNMPTGLDVTNAT